MICFWFHPIFFHATRHVDSRFDSIINLIYCSFRSLVEPHGHNWIGFSFFPSKKKHTYHRHIHMHMHTVWPNTEHQITERKRVFLIIYIGNSLGHVHICIEWFPDNQQPTTCINHLRINTLRLNSNSINVDCLFFFYSTTLRYIKHAFQSKYRVYTNERERWIHLKKEKN